MKISIPEFCQKYYIDRQHTDCLKWDSLQQYFGNPDLLPMWVADMDFQTPEAVRQALSSRINHGVFGYTEVSDSYYQTVSDWHQKHFGYQPEKDWFRFSPGVVPSLYWVVQAFTKPQDPVLILSPVYFPFYDAVIDSDRRLISSDLVHDHNGFYQMDLNDIEDKIKKYQIKLLIQCSPHNPVGRVWTESELEQLFALCQRYGVIIASDEIHQDIMIDQQHFISATTVAGGKYRDRLIILNSASKTFNLAGLGLSHVFIADPQLRRQYDQTTKVLSHAAPNILGMLATQTAYEQGGDWHNALLAVISHNYHVFRDILNSSLPELVISPLQGTYLAWVDMRRYIQPQALKHFFEQECRLAVHYGDTFGQNGSGFARFNLATHPDFIVQACQRMQMAINNR
ncbi:pyridoxal phosphate-dependent aminotransferase [Clostridiales bacterium COT073_COT-073]|nr:pyridoxal phosphate-dependent aminotransferase [Clostridiales bacterium COT073_COT-073]